jgi:trehalose/maltose transport system substrate-binding protein
LKTPAPNIAIRNRREALQIPLLPLFLLAGLGCEHHQPPPSNRTTLALVDRGLFDKAFVDVRNREYRQFRDQTGISVQLLPGPESAFEQLRLWQKLLGKGSDALPVPPDVFGIDVVWPGIFADDLIDLKPYVASDLAAYSPELIQNWTVNDRLVALPCRLDLGLLYYRTDLLERYGYHAPPDTWTDLEHMADRIQSGERARGRKNFWGYVWQGADSEALTCNALEWQASEGGGRIIEQDRKISVNNPSAIESWERAARWIGSISPPGITTYKENDATNLWAAGDAAFMRNWSGAYVASEAETSAVRARYKVTRLPRGRHSRASVFGGDGYSVSRRSTHLQQSVELVRYLCSRDVQLLRAKMISVPPTMPALYTDTGLVQSNRHIAELSRAVSEGMVARPSTVAGSKYSRVSTAYSGAIHTVLIRQKSGAAAARDLEKRLQQIMGA